MTRCFSRMGCVVPDPSRPSRWQRRADLGGLLGLLGEKHGVDVGEDAAGGDGDAAEKLVELLVVADGELQVSGNDAALLVVAGSIPSELKNLSTKVLENSSEVNRSAGTNTRGVSPLLEVPPNTCYRKLKPSLC